MHMEDIRLEPGKADTGGIHGFSQYELLSTSQLVTGRDLPRTTKHSQ